MSFRDPELFDDMLHRGMRAPQPPLGEECECGKASKRERPCSRQSPHRFTRRCLCPRATYAMLCEDGRGCDHAHCEEDEQRARPEDQGEAGQHHREGQEPCRQLGARGVDGERGPADHQQSCEEQAALQSVDIRGAAHEHDVQLVQRDEGDGASREGREPGADGGCQGHRHRDQQPGRTHAEVQGAQVIQALTHGLIRGGVVPQEERC